MAVAEAESEAPHKSTLFLSVWAICTLFWSIFTEPHRTFAGRVLLIQPLWIVRILLSDPTWVQDLGLFLFLHSLYTLGTGAWSLPRIDDLRWVNLQSETLLVYLQVFTLLGGCGVLAGTIVYRDQQLKNAEPKGRFLEQCIEESLLPPLLLPSRTSHSRTFPQKHAFSYSYLFAGIPVGSQGCIGNVLSIDNQRPAWFDVQSRDYLTRGNGHLSLGEKLQRYLHTQGVTDRDYAFAYLVTAPRVFGYSFNPVSFWYLYDSDTRLKYMVLEVNNTFDERRMYLLKSDDSQVDITDNIENGGGTEKYYFTDSWNKDFHVSPFNSRKGTYSLKAVDPLAAFQETGQVKIDNTIVLRSSKDSPKIIARVWSEGSPKDPSQVRSFEVAKFLAAWWWVGLATFPRIVWEAQKLFFRKKLHVWFRPETTEDSIGRDYTTDEIVLESFFHSFLTDAVEHAKQPLRVIYEPAHNDREEIVLYSPGFTYSEDHDFTLTLKIVSPAFYSRFIHYAHAKEAFDRECLATDEKNRTLSITGAHALPALLDALQDTSHHPNSSRPRPIVFDHVRWDLVRRFRCPPSAPSYGSYASQSDPDYAIQDIRSFQYSELDQYLRIFPTEAGPYRRIALKLFVAQRLFFGLSALVTVCDWMSRSAFIVVAMALADTSNALDLLRPRNYTRADLVTTGMVLLLANAVHLWSFIKGR